MSIFDAIFDAIFVGTPSENIRKKLFRKLRDPINLQTLPNSINGSIDKAVKEGYENFWFELDKITANIIYFLQLQSETFQPSPIGEEFSPSDYFEHQKATKERWVKALRNENIALIYYFETNNYKVLKDAFLELETSMINYLKLKKHDWNNRLHYLYEINPRTSKDVKNAVVDFEWMFEHKPLMGFGNAIFEAIHDDYFNGKSSYALFMSYWSEIAKSTFNTQLPILMSASDDLKEDITAALEKIYHRHLFALAKAESLIDSYSHIGRYFDSYSHMGSMITADRKFVRLIWEIKLPRITKKYTHKDLHKRKLVNSISDKKLSIQKYPPDMEILNLWTDTINEEYQQSYLAFPRIYSDTSLSGYFDPKQIPATLLPNELSQVCSYCKYENTLNASFCSGCGQKLTAL